MVGILARFRPATRNRRKPFLFEFRSHIYYIAAVTGVGLLVDVCLYPLFTPAIPFRLQELGYEDVSSLTGWLTASYAGGLILTCFPYAWLGSRYKQKRGLLLASLGLLIVALIVFLLVRNYAAMVVARALQGASGSGIWTLGLALVADNCEPEMLGQIMGLVMIGYSIGKIFSHQDRCLKQIAELPYQQVLPLASR